MNGGESAVTCLPCRAAKGLSSATSSPGSDGLAERLGAGAKTQRAVQGLVRRTEKETVRGNSSYLFFQGMSFVVILAIIHFPTQGLASLLLHQGTVLAIYVFLPMLRSVFIVCLFLAEPGVHELSLTVLGTHKYRRFSL